MNGTFGQVVDTSIDPEVDVLVEMAATVGVIGGPDRSETGFPTFTPEAIHFSRSGVCFRDLENNTNDELVTIPTGSVTCGRPSKSEEFLGIKLNWVCVFLFRVSLKEPTHSPLFLLLLSFRVSLISKYVT